MNCKEFKIERSKEKEMTRMHDDADRQLEVSKLESGTFTQLPRHKSCLLHLDSAKTLLMDRTYSNFHMTSSASLISVPFCSCFVARLQDTSCHVVVGNNNIIISAAAKQIH